MRDAFREISCRSRCRSSGAPKAVHPSGLLPVVRWQGCGRVNLPFRVLHVCTGNLCRSPVAEHLMRAALLARAGDAADHVAVSSAGTHGFPGDPMEPFAREVLGDRGVDGSAFRARELAADLVGRADLVLTATRQHRVAVVALAPDAAARTFTLREFARLAEGVDAADLPGVSAAERARALMPVLAQRRRPAPQPRQDDLPDPYRGPRQGFEVCAQTVEACLQVPLDLWMPTPRP